MNLYEFQSKQIFAKHGIPIPKGELAQTPEEAEEIAARLGGRVVVKAQVLAGGRGKAGGIRLAETPAEARAAAEAILGMQIKGLTVRRVLVDQAADIAQELYLGIVLDRAGRRLVLMASAAGGVDIEEVAATTPEKIARVDIDPLLGLQPYQMRQVACDIELDRALLTQFTRIGLGLYEALMYSDATLAEINPLAVTAGGELLALDGKMVVDDNGLYRQPELARAREMLDESPAEREARQYGLSYVKLDGYIGCMVNGAGLAMATMDMTKLYGGAPANFLDIGGGARADRVAAALRIILADPNVRAVLINIFGGITRCDEVARGILEAFAQVPSKVPVVVRLIGTNEEEGRRLLAEANFITARTLSEAARLAVEAAQAGAAVPAA
ncbi:MAG: ADP-forming succinate--CoA ligase subunit beta [Anaerolineae bacterium]|nr:ADP-forming succinate--CoA ligase subunit beta [Anaerolineae bacterium]